MMKETVKYLAMIGVSFMLLSFTYMATTFFTLFCVKMIIASVGLVFTFFPVSYLYSEMNKEKRDK